MANRSNIMGFHGLKNKPSRNSFDLSHRNMFTAKVGELLPCFVQELNPGDSVKVTSSYFTRTAPLQSNAFTRLRENVQYFFVPYSALWKYFDSQVLNMTKNANGGDISRIASSLVGNQKVTTQMPCVNYKTLHAYLLKFINRTSVGSDGTVGSEFNRGCYRHAESAKLLQLLGYGNFPEQFANFKVNNDKNNNSGLNFRDVTYKNSPYLSIFRLLAYHKICNDHYIYRQWQPYNASLCNVDYLSPNSSSLLNIDDALLSIPDDSIKADKLNLLDMRFSNLPLDYFTGVLPTSQFGDESVVNLNLGSATGSAVISGNTGTPAYSENYSSAVRSDGSLAKDYTARTTSQGFFFQNNEAVRIDSPHVHSFSGSAKVNTSLSGDLSIIALRNALAVQKYKEIQLANDVDFASQVQAHFGITPDEKNENSIFIGGSSSMININEQINQNLSGDNKATYGAAPQGNGSASIKYTAKTYGVVIGIYRCTPVLDFAHIGIDRTLFKTDACDFVIPELDSIGMQQTFRCEVAAPAPYNDEFSSFRADDGTPDMSETYGYAPRYSEFKTSYDRYNGAFCHSLKSWVTGINFDAIQNNIWNSWGGINAPNMFACRPDIVKNLFVVSSTNNADDDQLYVGMVNMCYATRNLSRYGLPYSN